MNPRLEERIRQRAYFLSLNGGGSSDETDFWLGAEREVMAEVVMESAVASPLTEAQSVKTENQTAVLNAIEAAPAAEEQKKTADKPPAAANGSALETKARLIADITKATNFALTLRSAMAATKHVAARTPLPKLSLDKLRDRISEDRITQDEVIAALREPLAGTDDGDIRSKLKQAITSANIYYSSRRWGQCRTIERAKARLIADLMKATA
jgi:hypothetical protein